MSSVVVILVTIIGSVGASTGFWTYLQRRDDRRSNKRSNNDSLLLGLAYDRIISLGFSYIERGWITQDEYEDYQRYFYIPYKALGGNGVTERIMAEVTGLPLRPRALYTVVIQEAKTRRAENGKSYDAVDAGILTEQH